ncbi:AraC family transcriptional regulator [Actinomycetospora lutea]|uniref:AraC family transcriptional regulator n=1 Tax=Actinomycetospora lutea TaxID=663604 RepID=UPI002366F528|nr:AraC family transcriptional regulator [Actinomycetospora lutea]MDD7938125.1 AraC family transcriptional regulator [Actinomycetospora lutea]
MTVVRADVTTDDPAQAEDLIRRVYVAQRLTLPSGVEGFAFAHETRAVTGPHSVAVNRVRHTLRLDLDAEPVDGLLVTDAVDRGAVHVHGSPDFDDVAARPGEVLLVPPTGTFRATVDRADVAVTVLGRREVAAHAAARTGIQAGAVRFTGLVPVSRHIGSLWIRTVAHVRDSVLAHDDLAAEVLVRDSVHRLLATAVLATFPNTALDALRDPLAAGPGGVGGAATDRAVDLLHARAGEPVGPAEVAELVGAPTRDVDAALRRRRNTTLARELWRARLRGAERDLRAGDPAAGDTVAEIAARWGFVSARTFAAAYTMSTGGEAPEETLRG